MTKAAAVTGVSQATEDKRRDVLDDANLAAIGTLADALSMLADAGINADDFKDYGNGFTICKDKRTLLGKPLVVIQWRFSKGKYDDDFVSAALITESGEKVILNDGSTGIREQLRTVTKRRLSAGASESAAHAGLTVRNGLTVSEYTYTNEKGEETPAQTYYFAQ